VVHGHAVGELRDRDDQTVSKRSSAEAQTPEAAPRTRKALAAAIDALPALAAVARARLGGHERAEGKTGAERLLPLLGPQSAIVRQQLGSPGQRIAGIRIVDRRTGRRLPLWRTVTLLGLESGSAALRRELKAGPPPMLDSERKRIEREVKEIHERHADDPGALMAALREHHEHNPPTGIDLNRLLWLPLALGLLTSRLRRRLAPTVVVRARDVRAPDRD
jgi:hypothetical protein